MFKRAFTLLKPKIPFYPVNPANPKVFFEIAIGSQPAGRVEM